MLHITGDCEIRPLKLKDFIRHQQREFTDPVTLLRPADPSPIISDKRLKEVYALIDEASIYIGFIPAHMVVARRMAYMFGAAGDLFDHTPRTVPLTEYVRLYSATSTSQTGCPGTMSFIYSFTLVRRRIHVTFWKMRYDRLPAEIIQLMATARRNGKIDNLLT